MLQRQKYFLDSSVIAVLIVIYFVLPKAMEFHVTGNASTYLGPWYMQRYALIALCLVYCVIRGFDVSYSKGEFVALVGAVLFTVLNIAAGKPATVWGASGSVAALILFKRYKLGFYEIQKPIYVLCVVAASIYVGQYLVYRNYTRFVASFIDPNISGYYLFLACVLLRVNRRKITNILYCIGLFFGFMSLSRNFVLAVLVFELLLLVFKKRPRFLLGMKKSVFVITLLSVVGIILLSHVFLAQETSAAANQAGLSRLTTFFDQSNTTRFQANEFFLSRVESGHLIFSGNGDGRYSPQIDFHMPHNAFFRAAFRYGVVCTLVLMGIFIGIGNYFFRATMFNRAMIIALFTYYWFLSDFITGPELMLFCVINMLVDYRVNRSEVGDARAIKSA